jgi:uncharacterized membrane protein YdjX (TVP38/TMEM64 family)
MSRPVGDADPPSGAAPATTTVNGVKEFAVYTLARIGLFLASWAILAGLATAAFGSPYWLWTLLAAAVISAIASYYLLKGPRERFAARVDARARAATARFEERRAKEDQD